MLKPLVFGAVVLSLLTMPSQGAAKRGFESFVLERTGAAAVSCGGFEGSPYGSERKVAEPTLKKISDVATAAWKSGRPFFFAVEGSAVDSWVATGLFRAKGGPIMVFWYDSARCGNASCKEAFSAYK